MPSIANQDWVVVEGTIEGLPPAIKVSEETKEKMRRAYVRGNIFNYRIQSRGTNPQEVDAMIINTTITTDNHLVVNLKGPSASSDSIDCGAIVPSDYTDEIPNE